MGASPANAKAQHPVPPKITDRGGADKALLLLAIN